MSRIHNKGTEHAEYQIILSLLASKLMDSYESPYDTVLEFIGEFDLLFEGSEGTGARNQENDQYDEIEYIYPINEKLGISFWWIETIPHIEDTTDNWKFDETLVKLVRPVKVERVEWQPLIKI